MVDVNTQNKTISVNVSSSGVSSNVNASGDAAMYYSNKSKEWATSNRIVDGVDYSSKYYADISKTKATEAANSATQASNVVEEVKEELDEVKEELDEKVTKTGDTMTGALKIQMPTPYQHFQSTNFSIDDEEFQTIGYITFRDKNNAAFGGLSIAHTSYGNHFSLVAYDQDGNAQTQPFVSGRDKTTGDFCSFPMAKTTPTTTSTARTNLISAVVANYRNGNTWYIKFSDNFKVQGGYVTQTGDGSVTLPLTLGALFAGVSTQVNHITNNGGARICNPRGTGFDYNSPSPFYWVVYGW